MELGQKVLRTPLTFNDNEDGGKRIARPLVGRVVFIHPKGRYHTVEFDLPGGKLLECFPGVED